MAGRSNGNGNGSGGRGNGGHGENVPRWVRTLFDEHERLLAQTKAEMAQTKAEMAQTKAEHEERMDRMDRHNAVLERAIQQQENRAEKTHGLALKLLAALGERDAQRLRDRDALSRVLGRMESRMERLEAPPAGPRSSR